jgi:putative endonuclease
MKRRAVGQRGEDMAVAFLQSQGYQVLERNWRCHGLGEIDVVAHRGDCLVFVEVRARRTDVYGAPEESLTPAKRQRMIALADAYVAQHGWQGDYRIDFIALEMDAQGRLTRRQHIENAVTGWD